jgi:TRAP-type mannitol/chloroaromatic compound transport system substrate-binding protein
MKTRRRNVLLGASAIAFAGGLPVPAIGQGTRELKMVTAWGSPREFPGQTASIERLVQSIAAASDGRLKVTVYPAESLVRALEVFDAVSDGVADMYHVDEKYFQSKSPGAQFLFSGALRHDH